MKLHTLKFWLFLLTACMALGACSPADESPEKNKATEQAANGKASLSVELVAVAQQTLPVKLTVNGSLAAWQEAQIGSQLSGVPVHSLLAQIGDTVKKGQTLAVFEQDSVKADLAQARAAVAEAQALYDQAKLNADSIRRITDKGAVSAQELNQILATEKSSLARLQSSKALQTQQEIRLRNTTVKALDDGIISARNVTLGAVPNPGQELFRLVRQQRLEWRAEVTSSEMAKIKPGMQANIFHDQQTFKGTVRTISPVVNEQSRSGTVYVDLKNAYANGLKPGMYLRGEFNIDQHTALVIPQTAVIERDGFTYAFGLNEKTGKVQRVKLKIGSTQGDVVQLLEGLKNGDKVVKSGVAFLADGDTVKVIR